MKQSRDVWLSLELAQSLLAVLDSKIGEEMHADDAKPLRGLVDKARAALDKAQSDLTDRLSAIQKSVDGI
jgi:hypothetical protein